MIKPSPSVADPTARAPTDAAHSPAQGDGRSADVVAILDALGALARALRLESSSTARFVGVSGGQWRALLAIAEVPACSVGEIARRTRTDVSSVSVVVKRLVAAGFVTRRGSIVDRRRWTTHLTRRGRAAVRRAPGGHPTRMGRVAGTLSPRVRRALAENMASLEAALRAH